MLLKHKFTPYFRATEIKVKCGSCSLERRRYLSMNIDRKHQEKRLLILSKANINKKHGAVVAQCVHF